MNRGRGGLPIWLTALMAALVVFGACALWNGVMRFLAARGDITAPVTSTASAELLRQTVTFQLPSDVPPLNLIFRTPTPSRPCIEFYVTVVRARVRECPREDCATLERPYEGNFICVYGPATDAPDWYEVNLDPKDPLPRLGYMHKSVIYPTNPTKRPTATPRPTRTPRESPTPAPLPTITATRESNP